MPRITGTKSRRTGNPTIRDVAGSAGVSFSLASLVLRGAPGPSAATSARVRQAAAEIGYRPNLAARSLRRGSNRLLGVSYRLTNTFVADIVKELLAAASTAGYDLVLGGWYDEATERKAALTLTGYRSAALILIGPKLSESELRDLAELEPVITITGGTSVPTVDTVINDDQQGMQMAVDYLVGLGHTKIVHVDGGPAVAAEVRRRAYMEAMAGHGLATQALVLPGGETLEAGVAAGRLVAASARDCTAVAAYNDDCAHGIIAALDDEGLSVPADVSVMGFDGGRYSNLLPNRLTTIRQDRVGLAEAAVRRAIERLEDGAPGGESIVLDPSLIEGRSAAPRNRDATPM